MIDLPNRQNFVLYSIVYINSAPIVVSVKINSMSVNMELDTGAAVSLGRPTVNTGYNYSCYVWYPIDTLFQEYECRCVPWWLTGNITISGSQREVAKFKGIG